MTELQEQKKLTGNVDTFPCWDNEMHKQLKLKYYSENVDKRLTNLELTKAANLDFNNRYFPIRSPGIPTLTSLVAEKELEMKASQHGLINKSKIYSYAEQYLAQHPPKSANELSQEYLHDFLLSLGENQPVEVAIEALRLARLSKRAKPYKHKPTSTIPFPNIINFEIEDANKKATDEYKEGLLIGYKDSMSALNNKRMKEAEKEASKRIILDDIANAEEEEQKASYVAPIGIPAYRIEEEEKYISPTHSTYSSSSSASTYAQSSIMPGTTIAEEHIPSMSEQEFKRHIKNKTSEQLKNDLFEIYKSKGSNPLKSGKYELHFSDTGKTVTFKESNTQQGVLLGNSTTKIPASKHVLETFFEDYTKPTKRNIQLHPNVNEELHSEFTHESAGFKIPKTKSALINRFNILRGEILASNDNPTIIKEITHLSKILYKKGLLDKFI